MKWMDNQILLFFPPSWFWALSLLLFTCGSSEQAIFSGRRFVVIMNSVCWIFSLKIEMVLNTKCYAVKRKPKHESLRAAKQIAARGLTGSGRPPVISFYWSHWYPGTLFSRQSNFQLSVHSSCGMCWFCFTLMCDWLIKLAPLKSQPIIGPFSSIPLFWLAVASGVYFGFGVRHAIEKCLIYGNCGEVTTGM